jgi:gluconolactonase
MWTGTEDLIIAQEAEGGGRAILRRNLTTSATTVVASSYQGKRLNSPNDVTSDARGRIYFTDARYFGSEPIELPNAVYRIDPDGRITQISTVSQSGWCAIRSAPRRTDSG